MGDLSAFLVNAEKDFKNIGFALSQGMYVPPKMVSTGFVNFDMMLGGGIPQGRFCELFGAEGSGKTTLTMQIAAHITHCGGRVVWVDAEDGLEENAPWRYGVVPGKMLIANPPHGEGCFDFISKMLDPECGETVPLTAGDLIVVDSLPGLVSQKELEKEEMAESQGQIGEFTRLLGRGISRIKARVRESRVSVILINQIRDVLNAAPYAPKTRTPGGHAIHHQVSARIALAQTGKIRVDGMLDGKPEKVVLGHYIEAKTEKCRYSNPFTPYPLVLYYGIGVSHGDSIVDAGIRTDLVTLGRGKVTYAGVDYSATKDKDARTVLRDTLVDNNNKPMFAALRDAVLATLVPLQSKTPDPEEIAEAEEEIAQKKARGKK